MSKVDSTRIAAVKANFETGDKVTETSLADLIDAIAEAAQDHEHAATGGSGSGTGDAGAITIWKTLVFCGHQDLEVGTSAAPSVLADAALIIDKVYVYVQTPPTGASAIFDVTKNGTTIFTNQDNRPEVAAGANAAESGVPDVTALAKNDRVDVDVDQVGSTTPGGKWTVMVRCKQTNVV